MTNEQTSFGYAELHCVSNYSFLCGASHPEELIEQAARLGYSAIAITDECSYAGLAKAHIAAQQHGIKLIVGTQFLVSATQGDTDEDADIDRDRDVLRLILLAPDREAYGQLAGLITKLRRRSPKGEYYATLDDFRVGLAGCLAIWVPLAADITTLVPQGRQGRTRILSQIKNPPSASQVIVIKQLVFYFYRR